MAMTDYYLTIAFGPLCSAYKLLSKQLSSKRGVALSGHTDKVNNRYKCLIRKCDYQCVGLDIFHELCDRI